MQKNNLFAIDIEHTAIDVLLLDHALPKPVLITCLECIFDSCPEFSRIRIELLQKFLSVSGYCDLACVACSNAIGEPSHLSKEFIPPYLFRLFMTGKSPVWQRHETK